MRILLIINKFNVKKFLPYLIVGIFLWDFTHNSGIHATIAGVLLAMTIPHRKKEKDFSLLIKVEHSISPYVAFGIMPLFAFANAGVSLDGLSFASLLNKVPLGILLGLFIGKQLGVFIFSYVSIKLIDSSLRQFLSYDDVITTVQMRIKMGTSVNEDFLSDVQTEV